MSLRRTDDSLSTTTPPRTRARLAIVVSLALLLTAGFLEVSLRLVLAPETRQQLRDAGMEVPEARWTNHPFLPMAGVPSVSYRHPVSVNGEEQWVEVRNNSYGFRTHEFERPLETDFVVVCLGGSTTWGEAAATNETAWPHLLERLLADRYPNRRIRVYNLALPMATSAHSLVTFGLIGKRLRPDVVITYHAANEVDALTRAVRWDYSHAFRDLGVVEVPFMARLPEVARSSLLILWTTGLLDRAWGSDDLSAHVNHRRSPTEWARLGLRIARDGDTSGVIEPWQMQLFFENLESIESMADARGGRSLFATFQFRDPLPVFSRFNERLREWLQGRGKPWVDVDAALPDHGTEINYDEFHFTEEGERRMARVFLAAIVEQNWVEGPR